MIHVFSYWCSRLGGHPQTSLAHFDSPRFPHPAQGPESRISPPSHQLLPQQHHSRAGLQHLTALPFPPMGPIKPSPPKSSCHSPTSICCHPQGSACCPGLGLFAHCPAASRGRCRKEPCLAALHGSRWHYGYPDRVSGATVDRATLYINGQFTGIRILCAPF